MLYNSEECINAVEQIVNSLQNESLLNSLLLFQWDISFLRALSLAEIN